MRGDIFRQVPVKAKPRSVFDLSKTHLTTMDMGELVPIYCREVYPGDKFSLDAPAFVRLAPMLAPIMHKVNVFQRFFFVPNRLLWSKFEDFITGGTDGTLAPAKPFAYAIRDLADDGYFRPGNLANYLLSCKAESDENPDSNDYDVPVDLLPFKAYDLIYNEYFRDENLQDPIELYLDDEGRMGSGSSYVPSKTVRHVDWEKDYFTSALPFAQRGPAITLPIGGQAPVTIPVQPVYISGDSEYITRIGVTGVTKDSIPTDDSKPVHQISNPDGDPSVSSHYGRFSRGVGTDYESLVTAIGGFLSGNPTALHTKAISGTADMSQVTGITINELRQLEKTQEWLEAEAIGGGRYKETAWVQFKQAIPDLRLMRPRYLGGGLAPVNISQVLQTAQPVDNGSTDNTAAGVGQMYGHGMSYNKFGFKKHFDEWGWIIGIMYILPRTSYFQGINRQFTRMDKFDYAWPLLAHLGEQEVKNYELYLDNSNSQPENNKTFGYQSRYAEVKYDFDTVSGDFAGSLDFWHMAREFSSLPKLNSNFVTANPTDRIWSVTESTFDHIWVMIDFKVRAIRDFPKFAMPSLA